MDVSINISEFTQHYHRKKRARQKVRVSQTWQGYYLCVLWWPSLNINVFLSQVLQKDLFKGRWLSLAESFSNKIVKFFKVSLSQLHFRLSLLLNQLPEIWASYATPLPHTPLSAPTMTPAHFVPWLELANIKWKLSTMLSYDDGHND